jgi:lysozyme family protein
MLCVFLAACSSSRFGRKFDYSFSRLIVVEGGYVNDPVDRGGETKYGISKRSYPDIDIKNLTLDQAKGIYYKDFWLKTKLDCVRNYEVASKLLDIAVNFGPERAYEIAQRALRSAYRDPHLLDGVEDWDTLVRFANNVPSNEAFLAALRSEQAAAYREIVSRREPMNKFLNVWMNRAYK